MVVKPRGEDLPLKQYTITGGALQDDIGMTFCTGWTGRLLVNTKTDIIEWVDDNNYDSRHLQPRFKLGEMKAHSITETAVSPVLAKRLEHAYFHRLNGWGCRAVYSGTDPEMFVVNKDGQNIPAFSIANNKKRPIHNPDNVSKLYSDGFAMELSFVQGFSCLETLVYHMMKTIEKIQERARKVDAAATLTAKPEIDVTTEGVSDENLELLCNASFNAYGLTGDPIHDPRAITKRWAGSHIHLSGQPVDNFLQKDEARVNKTIRCMDAICGIGGMLILSGKDSIERRKYYGLPGEYRKPSHGGLEYRTPSSLMLAHPRVWMAHMELARIAYTIGVSGMADQFILDRISSSDVVEAIRNQNVALGRQIWKTIHPYVDLAFALRAAQSLTTNTLFTLIDEGAEKYFGPMEEWEFANVWRLNNPNWSARMVANLASCF